MQCTSDVLDTWTETLMSEARTTGALRRLRINFSERYPLSPPEVYFIPPTPVRSLAPCLHRAQVQCASCEGYARKPLKENGHEKWTLDFTSDRITMITLFALCSSIGRFV